MPFPQQAHVETALCESEDTLVEIILGAWDSSAADRARHEFKRTHRCIVHDHIVRGARARFSGNPKVRLIEKHETAYLLFADAVAARIKKGDRSGLGRNNHTQASFAFVSADADPWELPIGLPNVQRADIVYILNDFETQIESILVTGRHGNTVLWNYPLYPRRALPIAVLPSLPIPPVDPGDVLRVPGEAGEKGDDKKAG